MRTISWALAPETIKKLEEAKEALESDIFDLRNGFEDRSEKWRESNEGLIVGGWIDRLDKLDETLGFVIEDEGGEPS